MAEVQGGLLGAQLRQRRRDLGLTQAELADLAGVSERSVRAVEQGKSTVQLDVVTHICAVLGLELVPRLRGSHDS